jgi:hypothetical protein
LGTVTDNAGHDPSAERSDAPRFEAEGRPPHDFFPDGEVIRLRLSPDYTPRPPVTAGCFCLWDYGRL